MARKFYCNTVTGYAGGGAVTTSSTPDKQALQALQRAINNLMHQVKQLPTPSPNVNSGAASEHLVSVPMGHVGRASGGIVANSGALVEIPMGHIK